MTHTTDDHGKWVITSTLAFPPPARVPYVQVLSFGAGIQGLQIFLGSPAPGSTEAVLPGGFLYVWGAGLVGFWVALLVAALWRDIITGVLIEGAACSVAILAVLSYAVGAFTVLGWDALQFPVLVTSLYGPACAIRLWQIVRDIRRTHRVLRRRRPPGG
jgi:hypothetical protein